MLRGIDPGSANAGTHYAAAIVTLGLSASWCTAGTIRPLITEIVPPEVRGAMLGGWIGVQTMLSSLAAPVVAMLAESVGYRTDPRPFAQMSSAEREGNADALSGALLWTMVLPWIPCLAFYTTMHWTASADRELFLESRATQQQQQQEDHHDGSRAEQQQVRKQGGEEEESAPGLRDSHAVSEEHRRLLLF